MHNSPSSSSASANGTSDGKHIVMTTLGSLGDLHPFIAIALGLQERGHRVTIATSELYRRKVTALGIGFHAVRPDMPDPSKDRAAVRKLMDMRTGGRYLFKKIIMPHLRESYEDLLEACRDADLLVSFSITYAGPIVAQKTGLRWASIAIMPINLCSAYDLPYPPGLPSLGRLRAYGPRVGRWIIDHTKRLTEYSVLPVYRLRAELGLPRGEHPLFEGQHSPHLVLAIFSEILSPVLPDWPPQTRITGFPFYDRRGQLRLGQQENAERNGTGENVASLGYGSAPHDDSRLSPELEQFLEAGAPPIVFTLGSAAVWSGRAFFEASAAAARRLGRRAVLLIGDNSNRPRQPLPEGVAVFDYAPYSQLFPRASAIVHQGGAGTTGQALRAGRPMLIVPFSHDQPDNAMRMVRLGIGRTVTLSRYTAKRAAAELQRLLDEPEYSRQATLLGQCVQAEDGVRAACDALEEQLYLADIGVDNGANTSGVRAVVAASSVG